MKCIRNTLSIKKKVRDSSFRHKNVLTITSDHHVTTKNKNLGFSKGLILLTIKVPKRLKLLLKLFITLLFIVNNIITNISTLKGSIFPSCKY